MTTIVEKEDDDTGGEHGEIQGEKASIIANIIIKISMEMTQSYLEPNCRKLGQSSGVLLLQHTDDD